MRIKGKVIQPPQPKILVIPRDEGDIVFKCAAVMDYSVFDKLVKEPQPPSKYIPKSGKTIQDRNHPGYLRKREEWATKRSNFMMLQSLAATEGLEWDTVDMDKPDTWANFRTELASHFTEPEISLIINAVFEANVPDEDRQQEALDRFTSSQEAESVKYTSPQEEPENIQSGEPVNV